LNFKGFPATTFFKSFTASANNSFEDDPATSG
jgi:hypothetical protein